MEADSQSIPGDLSEKGIHHSRQTSCSRTIGNRSQMNRVKKGRCPLHSRFMETSFGIVGKTLKSQTTYYCPGQVK